MVSLLAAMTVTLGAAGQDTQLNANRGASTTDGETVPMDVEYHGTEGQLDVPSPRLAGAEISIDGVADEEAWANAPVLTGFTQFDPVEGVPATQRTEARVLLTDDAIYFSVKAYDDVEGGVRATLGDRDSYGFSDDYVRFILDTFNDRRRGYVIMVNPLGVQQDGLWVVGGGGRRERRMGPPIDWNPDFVWDSQGQVHDWGYSVEVKLPLKSIKFKEAEVQDWGLQVERRIARNGYSESWAPVTANVANRMEQFGRLTGLSGLDAGLFLEINPVQTFSQQGVYDADAGALQRGGIDGDFGLNLTYGITSNLTLDGTYNPDFSQVEADAGQIRVNERFALYLREKRPFFLEGTEVFRLPQQLVYTRSIINPVGGAKIQGKIGSFNAGFLSAVDDVSSPDGLAESAHPVVNIFRLRRDLGTTSNVGMVYTDRTYNVDRFNRVAGIDGRFQFQQRYTMTLLAAGSRTAEGASDRTTGSLVSAQFARSGRNLQFDASMLDVTDDFLAQSGFIRRTGTTNLRSSISYNFRGQPGDLLERWGPSLEMEGFWDHDAFWQRNWAEERRVRLGGSLSFRNNITIWGNYSRSYFQFNPQDYEGLFAMATDGGSVPFRPDQSLFQGLNSGTLFIWVSPFDKVRGNVRVTRSETPLFDFITDTPVDIANSWSGNASLNLFLTTNFSSELEVTHTSLFRQRDGSLYSSATIPRVRGQYQFSRALFFRAIVEYGSQERGVLMTPTDGQHVSYCSSTSCRALQGSESNDFSIETLLSYEPTPGTVFFVGYSRRMEDMQAFRFRDIRPEAEGVFMKLSYRFRG
ncbi:MAG: carbohydrate binding family 9 domain-containing protein [Gemmatimonadetes bacterium]|nr:carbohydrate binding family 9 domain-containing protein [Gemmatimonadota bacterium]MXX73677.1 carbohydrate binding family 9 domain-containing protein [Gemmatimonadota bacterium]MYC93142.1 carbohydrate binding family 9 domain-containing protein [Gemmatimonadota bacterium]MYG36501.1 carbohydrate binding family 9 domain-containing protein [Gemmatimonadota bacterium]